MKVALDTNAYSAGARGEHAAMNAIQRINDLVMPLPVLAELRAGFQAGTLIHQNESLLQRFLNIRGVQILAPDEQTTFHYARLFTMMQRKGIPLPQNDLWIAALVVQHNCALLTYDTHFDHFPQIPRW